MSLYGISLFQTHTKFRADMRQKVLKENACCDVVFPFRSGFLAYNNGLISGAFSNYNTASQCEKEIKNCLIIYSNSLITC